MTREGRGGEGRGGEGRGGKGRGGEGRGGEEREGRGGGKQARKSNKKSYIWRQDNHAHLSLGLRHQCLLHEQGSGAVVEEPSHLFEGGDGSSADGSAGVSRAALPGVEHLPQQLPGINVGPLVVVRCPAWRRWELISKKST